MDKKDIIKQTEQFMRDNIPKSRITDDGSNQVYLTHILGARDYALKLAEIYDADKFVLEISALLHDIGADVGKSHPLESAKIAKEFLSKFNLSDKIVQKILSCIEKHSAGSKIETIEEQIMQDADGIIFIKTSSDYYFEKRKLKFPLEEAKIKSIDKVKEMMDKIKTKEGIKLAEEDFKKAMKYLESAN